MEFDQFTMLLLWQGDRAGEYDAAALDELQDGHLAHLSKLHDDGVLLAAGPALTAPDHPLCGFGIFGVDAEEATRLMADDPCVRAQRFRVEVVVWMVPSGAVNFTHIHFPMSRAEVTGG
jgi:uncharacterized protein YciI